MLHKLLYLCSIFVFISTKSYKNESFLSRFKYFSYLCAYISKLPISNCSMYYQANNKKNILWTKQSNKSVKG